MAERTSVLSGACSFLCSLWYKYIPELNRQFIFQICVWQSSDEGHCINFFLSPRPCQCDAIWLIKYTHLKALKPAFIALLQNYNINSESIHWFISVIQSWLKPQAMKSNQGQPGTRGPLVLLTMTALQANNFISCFVLTFNWKCHILVKVIKENDVHYQNVKSTSRLTSKMIFITRTALQLAPKSLHWVHERRRLSWLWRSWCFFFKSVFALFGDTQRVQNWSKK